jgi:hypothetical protein
MSTVGEEGAKLMRCEDEEDDGEMFRSNGRGMTERICILARKRAVASHGCSFFMPLAHPVSNPCANLGGAQPGSTCGGHEARWERAMRPLEVPPASCPAIPSHLRQRRLLVRPPARPRRASSTPEPTFGTTMGQMGRCNGRRRRTPGEGVSLPGGTDLHCSASERVQGGGDRIVPPTEIQRTVTKLRMPRLHIIKYRQTDGQAPPGLE